MPRKSRKKQPVAETVEALRAEVPGLQTAVDLLEPTDDLAPPEREVVTTPERDPVRQGFTTRVRPEGPRKRQGEPVASFASDDLRIIKDGHMWQLEAKRELTGDEKDRLAASGFHSVDDSEQVWNASQRELAERGTDINNVAFQLGKKAIAGRGR